MIDFITFYIHTLGYYKNGMLAKMEKCDSKKSFLLVQDIQRGKKLARFCVIHTQLV